jgi:polyferredoxin
MITARLLGRRALMMDISGERMKVARRKDIWLNKIVLSISFLLVAMLIAIIPLLYFFPPYVIWSFITLHPLPEAKGLLWIYTICTLVVLIDVAVMRHLVCKFMCVYRVWQHSFKTTETLHIAYEEARSADCENCHYCVDSCFLDIDPRQTQVFDSCINCGECITACDTLHSKSKKMHGPGLLSFSFGANDDDSNGLTSLLSRTRAAAVGAVLGIALFIVGLMGYQPYILVVDRAELMQGMTDYDYRIHVAHKRYTPAQMTLRVDGIPASLYTLENTTVKWDSVGRQDIMLHFSPKIKKGLHRINIHAKSNDGWKDTFVVYYYAK